MLKPTHPTYPKPCGWNEMLTPRAAQLSLAQDVSVDYAIIGAGYTGLAAARRLHEHDPQARIAVLEATEVGEGSSARNSGFTSPEVLPRNQTLEGAAKAKSQTGLVREAFDWLTDIIERHEIVCDIQRVGAIRAAATEAGEASLRKVLAVANTMDAGFCIEALKEALARYGPPEIFNSDQGSQFTSTDFTDVLRDAKVKISMDGRGRWIDNRMIERLWRSLKYECVYLNAFETGSETRNGIGAWITYYNEKRPHSSHGLLTPAEAYDTRNQYLNAAAA